KIVRAVITTFSQRVEVVCRSVAFCDGSRWRPAGGPWHRCCLPWSLPRRAQPAPPFAQCPGGDRPGGPPRSLQEHAKVLELDDELVVDSDQVVGAFAFAFVIHPLPCRTLLFGSKLSFELLDPHLECGNHIGHRLAAR